MHDGQTPTVLFDRYRIDGMLGEGGQAVVLQVYDQRLDVPRALKALLPAAARRRTLRERFEREARLLARIEHPNVLRIYDVEVDVPVPFFVAELVTGGSLADRIARRPMPPHLVGTVVEEVCAGLSAVHAHGVVHRDVKPQNVLVSAAGVCKLVDFGIARGEDGGRTKAGTAMGTEGFMPPEQIADATSVDVRADVYAVGMMAYVLLSRRDPVRWLGGESTGLPDALLPVLRRATEQDRARRTPDAATLAAEFRAALAEVPPDPPGTSLTAEFAPRPSRADEDAKRFAEVLSWFTTPLEPASGPLPAAPPPPRPGDRTPSVPPGGYLMPKMAERSEEAPAWLAEDLQAPEPPAPAPAAPPPVEPEPPGPSIPWLPVLAVALLLTLVVGGFGYWQLQRAVESERVRVEARTRLNRSVRDEVALLGTLQQLGSDPDVLSTLLTAFERAPDEDARAVAAARLTDHLSAEVERLTVPSSAQRASLEQQLVEMQRATAAWRSIDPAATP